MATPKELYHVLHIMDVESELESPPAKSWEELEKDIVRLLQSDHFVEGDTLFLVILDGDRRLKDITHFDPDFMEEMQARAAEGE